MEDYARAVDHLLVQLERDGQLPQMHLLDIVEDLTKCSVMDFRVQWMGRRPAIERFLRESTGKDEAAILALPGYVHFSDLLAEAKDAYHDLRSVWDKSKR